MEMRKIKFRFDGDPHMKHEDYDAIRNVVRLFGGKLSSIKLSQDGTYVTTEIPADRLAAALLGLGETPRVSEVEEPRE